MSDTPPNSDYLAGRFFVGLLLLTALIFAASTLWFLHTGVSHWRGTTSVRAFNPSGFWTDVVFHGIIAVGACGLAYSIRDFAKRS